MTEATMTQNGISRVPRGVLNLLITLLFTGLLLFVGSWAAIVWNSARASELKIVEQEQRLTAQDQRLSAVEQMLRNIDHKLDRLIERGK